ncbi:MAG: hypothetical protein IKN42_00500, partial [Elusimicrobia bacterium]|nr:hypothetical protein [Elusimicrobiota bacterium]
MFNKIIKKSSKLIAVVLAITLTFSPLSYAGDVGSFSEFITAISDGTATIDIINSFTADPGDGPLGTQIASILAINGNNYVVDAANKAGLIIGSGKETTINDLTFKNFSATSGKGGSAIHNSGNLTLTGVNFSTNTYSLGNQNTQGGSAIYNEENATITITNGVFRFNKNTSSGQSYGGAIYNIGTMNMGNGLEVSSNSTTLTGSTKSNGGSIYNGGTGDLTIGNYSLFQFNKAKQGGAISNDGDMTIGTDAHFYHNESTTDSGAIGIWSGQTKIATLTIGDRALFDFNKSKDAGAVYNKAKSITEIGENARFISNTATNTAGAIRNADSASLTIKDGALFEYNTVTDNTGKGGAIYNEGTNVNKTKVNLGSVIFNENSATGNKGEAGAIYNKNATLTISKGAVFSTNTAGDYGGAIENTDNAVMSIGDPAITDPEITINFIYNSASRGGAVDNYKNSTITIGNNVDFSSNTAILAGAAIFNETGSTITIGNNVNFHYNTVTTGDNHYGGGAIWNNDNSTITIGNNVTFSSNASNTFGGAIHNAGNSTININGDKISFISNTAERYGGAIYSRDNSFVNIGNNAEFKSNTAGRYGGAIYNDTGSEITIADGAKFEDNSSTNTDYESGAIYNAGTINIGTSTFKNNKTGTKNRDIYNTGNLNFTIDSSVTVGTTTMTGGISNDGNTDKGITTIKSGVTLMVGYNEDETTASGAIFKQNNVVVEERAKLYLNVNLTNDFKINNTVTTQAGSEIYINGSGTLEWNTTGEGDFYYNGENIIIKADNLQHGTMNITGNNNIVTRISRTDGETPITTVNAINAPNATFINNGIFNLNLSSSDGYNLKTLTNSETDKGTFNINVKDNITLDLTDKTIQQKETVVSSVNSSSLTVKNAELNSDLVNNLSGEGLILQESEVKGQLRNQGQMVLEDSEVDGQIINNQGTMTILGNFVIQNGIASAGYSAQYNTINIGNASKSATVRSSTTISDQTIIISSGSLIMENNSVDGTISNSSITVNTNGILTANANNISTYNNTEITNEGTINFTGGQNKNEIFGTGNLTIDGTVTNKTETSIVQGTITINSGKSFTANASDITTTGDGIVNRGSVTFTGTGTTNANKITGDGELTISGSVTNLSEIEESTITVTSGNMLTTDADKIDTTEGIVNEGSLVFVDTDGTNKNKISGDGILTINGKVENETGTSIEQNSISIMTNKSFTANADDITTANGIVNVGTLILTGGTNTNNINPGFSDAGRLEIKGDVENAENIAQKEVEVVSGRLTNNEGKTITATTLTNNGEIINSGTITGRTGANNAVSNKGKITNTGRIQATDISNEENAVIRNEGTIESGNYILNRGTITSNADNIIINGSNKEIKNSGIYNITGGTANYKITGDSENKGIVNIKNDGVKINDVISNSTINLGTALNVSNDSYLDTTSTLIIENGAILITDNASVNEIGATINILDGAQWEYQLDVDLQNELADRLLHIETVGDGSLATISSIHLANDTTTAKTVLIANKDINAYIPENIRIYTTNYRYVVVSSTDTEGRTWLNIQAAGFGGLQGAVYEGASTYNVTGSIDYLTAWIEEGGKLHDTLKANLEIVGYNNVLKSTTGASGIKTSTYTLKVTDLNEYSGFENAITVQKIGNEIGKLIVSTVTFRNNSGSAVIINAGDVELSNVTFSNNSADIDIENNGNLKISKDDVTLDKGIDGIGNTTIEKGATLVNGEGSIIIQSSMTVAGTLTNNNVNENVIVATDKIEVKNDGKIITNASAINTINGIINAGTVTFTGGRNSDVITGDNGRLEIAGTVQNDSKVTQKEVEVTGNLINNAGKTISATTVTNKSEAEIANSGIINATTLTNETGATIGNAGEIKAATLTNNTGATITNTGTITGTNNTITNSGNVTNSGTINATTLTNSGTISNSGIIDSENTITNSGTITSDARRVRTEVNNSGTYNITGGEVIYKITGTNGTININTNEVIISTSISNNNINLSKKLTLEDENYLENSTLTIQNGAILITDNGTTADVKGTVNIENDAKWDYQLDINLQGTAADNLTIGSVGERSTATITSIRLANDKATQTKVEIASKDIHAEISNELNIYSTTLNYKVTSIVENEKTILVLEAIGYGGLADAIYDKASDYSVTEGQDVTTSWINGNDTLKKNLKVHGNNSILTSTTSLSGIKTSTYTLTINDLQEYSGFTNAITVNDVSGKLEVNNVTFTENKGTAVITNEGTVELSSVTFKNNSATIDIANNGEVKVTGDKTVLEKGIKGLGNTTIENGAELENGTGSKISQSNITIAGTLTNKNESANSIVATENLKIEQLTGTLITNAGAIGTINGIENKGTLKFTGGTNKNEITGDGELVIDGEEVINKNGTEISQKKITVNEEKKLKANASDITTDVNYGIVNAGTIDFVGGKNENKISGDGELDITGTVENAADVSQGKVDIKDTGKLTNNSGKTITATEVTNSGTVSNAGTVEVTTLTNNATITNSGTITGTDNTITNKGEITNSGTISAKTIE